MAKRPLTDKEKEFNEKRIKEATETVELCDYQIEENRNELERGINLKARENKRICEQNIKTLEVKKESELKLAEILRDQNENGVEPKEEKEENE
jgi:hypothetical protein